MVKFHISYNDIVQKAQLGAYAVCVDDAVIWSAPIKEFGLNCHITKPLRAELHILPIGDDSAADAHGASGVLVRGTLTGSVVQSCDLCAEDAPVEIQHSFELFETLPRQDTLGGAAQALSKKDASSFDDDFDELDTDNDESHLVYKGSALVLDVAALCWEEFMLALPMRPLCGSACKGLCALCGANLNTGSCQCEKAGGDPRLAVLRGLKIQS